MPTRQRRGGMNDQVVEIGSPGLHILLYSPHALSELEAGGDYGRHFPDGADLVDYINACKMGAIGIRWPAREYWLHFSATMDHSVIARASDHVRMGVTVSGQVLCVRASDDLFKWSTECPNEQLITLEDGVYEVTACMVPYDGEGPVRIYLHFAPTPARPELGYDRVPELFGEPPVL
jgi:hypothetical protein